MRAELHGGPMDGVVMQIPRSAEESGMLNVVEKRSVLLCDLLAGYEPDPEDLKFWRYQRSWMRIRGVERPYWRYAGKS